MRAVARLEVNGFVDCCRIKRSRRRKTGVQLFVCGHCSNKIVIFKTKADAGHRPISAREWLYNVATRM